MFPSALFFFIFMIIIDVVLKSIKDKQRIEVEKAKREKKNDLDVSTNRKDFSPKKSIEIDYYRGNGELLEDSEKYSLEMKPWDEPFFPEVDDKKVQSISKINTKGKRKRLSSKQMKKDILKGVIYSEILQEPLSMRNKRKSM